MRDRNRNILKEAVVLLIVSVMVLSVIPAVTAADSNDRVGGTLFRAEAPSGLNNIYDTCRPLPRTTPNMGGGVGVDAWVGYNDGYCENSLGLNSLGQITMAITLTDTELAAYRDYDINELYVCVGSDDFGFYSVDYDVWIEPGLPAYGDVYTGGVNIVYSGTSSGTGWDTIDIPDTAVPATGDVTIGLNMYDPGAGTFPCGIDESNTAPAPRANHVTYDGYGSWDNLNTLGFPGVWGLDVGLCAGGGPGPVGDCLPDQCDFELVSINNIAPGPINSLPQIINITIRNNGEVGIPELKLLADVYEKVCGPTTEICCDNVYDLCDWEAQTAADWTVTDDGDMDSFVLQGGPGNRWLTNDQAWRNTMGEDRSFGGDEDKYLGLSPGSVGFDTLTWHCADSNDISGAACAEFSFSHWVEGEYFIDANGDVKPIDYGTIAYSLDDGMSWTDIAIADFVAYDSEDLWQEVTIKFINTAIYEDEGYYEVCDDCEPAEGDIIIDEPFPTIAKLQVKFIWHKDPCQQYEGWYIDETCLTRTEMYELILVHQTHDIIEMLPCDPQVGPQDVYYEFPLGFDPEPDTWYQICILGQVFDCPDCCELIFDNNEMCIQFFVTDIHDMACVGNEIIDPQDFWSEGDTICVNATVQNVGTFAEYNVPVDLKVGQQIVDRIIDQPFESDTMDDWDYYYFTGSSPEVYFRWTQGDATISDIGDGRSILPGSESVICAEQGFLYPYLPNGAGCGMAWPDTFDLGDVLSADLNFYAKWSIPPNADCDGDGYIDSFWAVLIHPTSGPDSAYWWYSGGGAYMNYENDWQYMSFDLKAEAESFAYDGTIPEIELLIGCFMCTADGNTVPVGNPIPWSGLMIDNVQFDVKSCGPMEVVDTVYTGSLAPGATETLVLCWDDVDYSNWCFAKDVQLPEDVDTSNDVCWDHDVKVRDTFDLDDWSTWDLTDGGDEDCLWTICSTRSCDGTSCAWAGIEDATSGHYIPDMDDNMISPWIPIDKTLYPLGVQMDLTTWFDFCGDPGDYGEVYVRGSTTSPWIKLKDTVGFSDKITGDSGGVHVMKSYYIDQTMFDTQIQIRFRMVSDSDAIVCEGWYICNVELYEVTAIGPPPAPGGDTSYIIDAGVSSFNWFDVATPGTINYIGPYPDPSFPQGACFVMDVLWFTDTDGDIYTIDPGTGVFTSVGNSGTAGGLTCIAYDDSTGTLYGASTTELYTINMGSGIGTSVGPLTGITSLWISMDFDNNGDLYGYDLGGVGSSGLYSVNKGTGACTLVGYTGLNLNYGQDMSFDKDNDIMYAAAYAGSTALYTVDLGSGAFTLVGALAGSQFTSFAIPYVSADVPIAWGVLVWSDDFERLSIAPWQCVSIPGGNYWETQSQCIFGYPLDLHVNNAMYTSIDLTAEELYFAELYFTTEWDIEDGVDIFIEISPDWDGIEPMQDATWVSYWFQEGASAQGLISSVDLVADDRFILNEYLGEEIYLRFRLETAGDGTGISQTGFWCIHDKQIIFKAGEQIPDEDLEAPVTNAFFDGDTAKVTLQSVDYPLDRPNCGVKATYYKVDSGDFATYTQPVTIPEGTHTIYFYAEDNCANVESEKSKTYTVDTTPPTVDIIVPEEGKLYLFGSPIMDRILSDITLCIGKVPIEATADDAGGSGVNKVLFAFNGGTSWDESSPYEALFKGMHFGDLTITVTAIDNVGLESAPDTMTLKVYSLGLF